MNNKLKELAKQCNFTEQDIADLSPGLEKFAELLVNECCKEIAEEPFNAGAASVWLKQYFEIGHNDKVEIPVANKQIEKKFGSKHE